MFERKHKLKFISRQHFKKFGNVDRHLIVFRIAAVVLWMGASIFDTFVYFKKIPDEFHFRFAYNLNFIAYEISAIIYASGAPAMGLSIESIPLLGLSILNPVAANHNCENHEVTVTRFLIAKTSALLLGTELMYRNFVKKFPNSYQESFNSSATNMLYQSLLFSMTMLFIMAPGLRAVWDAADMNRHCKYTMKTCYFFNMFEPEFGEGNICEIHQIEYLKGREEVRILRAFLLLNIASYSIYNQPLLQIRGDFQSKWIKIVTMFAFMILSMAVLITCIHPFKYPSIKIYFDYIEIIIFIITVLFLSYKLFYYWRNQRDNGQQEEDDKMETEPHILPHH